MENALPWLDLNVDVASEDGSEGPEPPSRESVKPSQLSRESVKPQVVMAIVTSVIAMMAVVIHLMGSPQLFPFDLSREYLLLQNSLSNFLNAAAGRMQTRTESRWWVKERSLIWYDYYLPHSYDDQRWISTLRMPKRVFQFIVSKLAPHIAKADTQFRKSVPAEVRVKAVLFRLATASNYFHVGERFGIGLATVQEFFPKVITAIIRVLGPLYLRWPTSKEMVAISRKFQRKCGLPNVQRVIDGTFIPVRAPQKDADCYFNRKWYTSLVLQAVSDTDGAFLDISCGLPGSVNDRRVLRRSKLLEKVEEGEILSAHVISINDGFQLGPYLLGDAGYILTPWLMMPISLGPNTSAQERLFTERQIRGRICIERAFSILKARWRILQLAITSHISWAARIVHACAVLHNLLIKNGVEMNDHTAVRENTRPQQAALSAAVRSSRSSGVRAHAVPTALCLL